MPKRRRAPLRRKLSTKRQRQALKPDTDGRSSGLASPEFVNPQDSVPCSVCGDKSRYHEFVLCDACHNGQHTDCAGLEEVPEGFWTCPDCVSHPGLDSAIRQVLHSAGKQGLYSNQLLIEVRQKPTTQCSRKQLDDALHQAVGSTGLFDPDWVVVSVTDDRYALRPNPVYDEPVAEPHLFISDSEPDSMDDDFAPDTKWLPAKRNTTSHHSCTPSSHPLQSEASVPMTVDQQAETPLSQDNRDHSPEQACTAAATDTDSPDSFTGSQSGKSQQQPGIQEEERHVSNTQMHSGQDCETGAAALTMDDYVSQQGAALLTGLCQYYNMSPAAQLGAMAGLLWHLKANSSRFQVLCTDHQTGSAAECTVTQSKEPSHAEQQLTSCIQAASTGVQQLVLDLENQPATAIHCVGKSSVSPTQQAVPSPVSAPAVQSDRQAVLQHPAANLHEMSAAHEQGLLSIEQSSSHNKAEGNRQQAFLVLARVVAAEHQSVGHVDELQLLSQILEQVPGLSRFRDAFASWKQGISDVVVHEIYRVLHLLAHTKESAPMVHTFLPKYFQTLLADQI